MAAFRWSRLAVGVACCHPSPPALAPRPAFLKEETVVSFFLSRSDQKPPPLRTAQSGTVNPFEDIDAFGELPGLARSSRFHSPLDDLCSCILGCQQCFFENSLRQVIAIPDEFLEPFHLDAGHAYPLILCKSEIIRIVLIWDCQVDEDSCADSFPASCLKYASHSIHSGMERVASSSATVRPSSRANRNRARRSARPASFFPVPCAPLQ